MTENNQTKNDESAAMVEVIAPTQQILAPLELSDYSQFLYETFYGGRKGQDFTSEGIKTLGLHNGISTGDVKIEFLNEEKIEVLFYCTATHANGNASERIVKQCEMENGRKNPTWVEKGVARAERNAIKARLPVQLFKTALQKAMAAGEARQSAIVKAQRKLSATWCSRDESLCNIDKRQFYAAAQAEYGDAETWDAKTWYQVANDLENMVEWVREVMP